MVHGAVAKGAHAIMFGFLRQAGQLHHCEEGLLEHILGFAVTQAERAAVKNQPHRLGLVKLLIPRQFCLVHSRSHLINNGRWRGQRFGPATRREEEASPQWGCDRRPKTWLAPKSPTPIPFSPIVSSIF